MKNKGGIWTAILVLMIFGNLVLLYSDFCVDYPDDGSWDEPTYVVDSDGERHECDDNGCYDDDE